MGRVWEVGERAGGEREVCWLCMPRGQKEAKKRPLELFSRLAAAEWADECKNISFFQPKKALLAQTFCSFWLFYHDPRVDGFFKVSEILELRIDDDAMAEADSWLEKSRMDAMIPREPANNKKKRKTL